MIAAALERLRRPVTRGAGPIVLSGALSSLLVFALVASSPPLYEAEAVLSPVSSGLLEQYDRFASGADTRGPRDARKSNSIERADLGEVGALAAIARAGLGPAGAVAEVDLRMDPTTGEAAVIARSPGRHASPRLANEVASAIVSLRDAATTAHHASARTELRLLAALSKQEPRLRAREAALRIRIAELAALRRTPGGGLKVLRQAMTPTQPVGPRVARDVVLAAVAGVLVALTLRGLWRAAPARVRRLGLAGA